MIGATIRLGASQHSLSMNGHVWDLSLLDRSKIATLGGLLCDALGIVAKPSRQSRRSRMNNPNSTAANAREG